MHNNSNISNIANFSYENDSVTNFVQASLFQALLNERIPAWELTDFDGNYVPITPFISQVAYQLANNDQHYAAIYISDDYNIDLEKANSFQELLDIYDNDPDSIESNRTTFLYQENETEYQLDFILDC